MSAPLLQALVQIRFPLLAHLQTVEGIARLQDRLKDRLPYLSPRTGNPMALQLHIGVGGLGVDSSNSFAGWEFRDDFGHLLVVEAGALSLVAGSEYSGISRFMELFQQIVTEFAVAEQPRRYERLGVRYLSLAETELANPHEWAEWFRPELTGWVGDATILATEAQIVSSLTQVQIAGAVDLELGEGSGVPQGVLKHGWVPRGSLLPGVPPIQTRNPGYLLDLDFFIMAPQNYDSERIVGQFSWLHGQIDRFFAWSLTEEGRTHFKYEEL